MATRSLSSGVINALDDDVLHPFTAVELKFDDDDGTRPSEVGYTGENTIRLWTGVGTLVYGGQSWVGAGELIEISSIEETAEISAKGATITLSGIPSEVIALALTNTYQNRIGNIYFGLLKKGYLETESNGYILLENGSKIFLEGQETSLTEIFSGFMDTMTIEESADSCTIAVTLENKLTTLERPRVARFTHQFQKTVDPTDLGLEFVESIQLKEVVWGPNG